MEIFACLANIIFMEEEKRNLQSDATEGKLKRANRKEEIHMKNNTDFWLD